MLVDNRIHFDDFEAQHAAVVGNDFHGQMSFAIGRAAADGSAHARSVFGIDPVHIERDVITGGTAAGNAESFLHYGPHTAFIDVAHGEDANAGTAHVFFFDGVDVAHSDE